MPHEFQFVDAVIQAPVTVLGLRMRNYSLGAEVILSRQKNPLVILSGTQFSVFTPNSQIAAIQNAALVCYRSWTENQRPEKWLRLWQWRIRKMDHGQAIEDFLKYRADGSTFPPATSEEARDVEGREKGGRLLGAPFLCRVYQFLTSLPDREIRQFGETAFDFPFGFACFLYLTHLENAGAYQIENEKESQIKEEFQKHISDIPEDRRLA